MCGIAGIVHAGAPRDNSTTVRKMIALQRHRGPDGEGFYTSSHAALGHCRLAILDVSAAGHQPMPDPDQRYWLTFNGEIYNYLELADQLRSEGHRFRSRSDTEVLLAAYRQWGIGCLERLRGMFAFAIWDERDQRLFAARDRLGIKPFHYVVNSDQTQLAFASELKALQEVLPHWRVNERLAREFLAWNLLDHDPAETMLQGVWRLPQGHYLTWDAHDGLKLRRYWSLEINDALHSTERERPKYIAEFREQFAESVSLHLRSDVPVGSCLSGGLDSSAIVCAVKAELQGRGAWQTDWQHTFSACFEDPHLDERPYIRAVTEATQSRNHQVFPTGQRMADEMDRWLWHQEEPVGGSGVYAQYCVARLAHQTGVKVLPDGQGADEQLAGYRKFIFVYLRQLYESGYYFEAARDAVAFFSSWDILKTSQLADGRGYVSSSTPELAIVWGSVPCPPRPSRLRLGGSLGRRLQADMTMFSLPLLLRFEDRNTMAFGVESRVPYVDHVFVEWMATLPADLRLSRGWTKLILRESLRDLLPPMIRSRKTKLGFSTPESAWLHGPLKPWLAEMLTHPSYLDAIVDPAGVAQLWALHARGKTSQAMAKILFRLAVYENWGRLFLDSTAKAPAMQSGVASDRPSVAAAATDRKS